MIMFEVGVFGYFFVTVVSFDTDESFHFMVLSDELVLVVVVGK